MAIDRWDQLWIIAGCLLFLCLCTLIMVCKLSPLCCLHQYCPFRPKYEDEEFMVTRSPDYKTLTQFGDTVSSSEKPGTSFLEPPKPLHSTDTPTSDSDTGYFFNPTAFRSSKGAGDSGGDSSDSGSATSAAYMVRGEITFSFWYSQINEHIYLNIQTINNLVQRRKEKGKVCVTLQAIDVEKNRDRYMKFYEQLDQHELNKKIKREVQTSVKSPTKVIKFHETIGVHIPKADVKHFIFRLVCSSIGHFSQSVPLGEAVLTLEESDLCPKEQEQSKTMQLVMPPQEEKGEVLLGINYLPTAQKLSLQVQQCKNLRLINTDPHRSEVYVRATILKKGVYNKRRVPAQDAAPDLSWDETVSFDLPPDHIPEISLVVSLKQVFTKSMGLKKQEHTIGKVIFGMKTGTPRAQAHFNEMLRNPRQPLIHWHPVY